MTPPTFHPHSTADAETSADDRDKSSSAPAAREGNSHAKVKGDVTETGEVKTKPKKAKLKKSKLKLEKAKKTKLSEARLKSYGF